MRAIVVAGNAEGAVGTALTLQVSGRLADRVGRRPLILVGLAVMGLSVGVIGLARHPDLSVTTGVAVLLALSAVGVDLTVTDDSVDIAATVRTTDRTGVEMEALTAVSVAALTVVDMVKAVDKAAVITDIRVETKTGGKSGDWAR